MPYILNILIEMDEDEDLQLPNFRSKVSASLTVEDISDDSAETMPVRSP